MILNVRNGLEMRIRSTDKSEEIFNVINENRSFLRVWLPWVDSTKSSEDIKATSIKWQKAFEDRTDIILCIYMNEIYIGNIGLHNIDTFNNEAKIGYWLAEKYQGKGIMTDCVRVLLNYSFNVLNLNRVNIYCATENNKSRAIPERLGFTLEGIQHNAENFNGKFVDHAVYSMLRSTWQPNLFRNTAQLYDLDQRDIVIDDIPFYLEYAEKQASEILELACGTGRVTLELARRGFTVTGLDLSNEMLNIFKQKLNIESALKERINIIHENMASFTLGKKFKLIIAPFRAFQALTDDNDIRSCLLCIRNQLDTNGIFIVNVFRPYKKLDQSWCYDEVVQWERIDERTGNRIVKKHWGDKIDIEKQIIYPHFAYEVTKLDGKTERLTEHLNLKYYYYEQLKDLLNKNNFRIIEEYGWYDKSDIQNGRELIFVCSKV